MFNNCQCGVLKSRDFNFLSFWYEKDKKLLDIDSTGVMGE
jgi:hypothetical protein